VSTILLLDDERPILTLLARMLEPIGHTVLEASTAADALRHFEETDGALDLLIADVTLAGRSGVDVALELWSLLPNLRIVFTSGHPPDLWSEPDRALLYELPAYTYSVLAKPFITDELRDAVSDFLGLPPRPGLARFPENYINIARSA
jgi:DNA-binding response OmpR family regulator